MSLKKDGVKQRPYADLGIIVLDSCSGIKKEVNDFIIERRKKSNRKEPVSEEIPDSYMIKTKNIRFSDGAGKVMLDESIRGKDIYILADVGNYSQTYEMFGKTCSMGPDEHFQDIKRTISAVAGKARRISVIMPLLYSGRQHKRKTRESLDCALALQELERMGVQNILTFDAHDPRVQNAIPFIGFESLHSTYEIVRGLVENENNLNVDRDKIMVISPDTGAMDRAIYYANVMRLDVGLFYKRRNYSEIVNGKNPIVQHEYIGADVAGKDILIVDDIISSGETVLDIAAELKDRDANKIYIAVTFGLFTEGIERFDSFYKDGKLNRVYTTNLTYNSPELLKRDWFEEVNMAAFIGLLIDHLNYDQSISPFFDETDRIEELLHGN